MISKQKKTYSNYTVTKRSQKRRRHSQAGIVLINALFIFALGTVVSIGMVHSLSLLQNRFQARTAPVQLDIVRRNIQSLLMSQAAWQATVARNSSMACLSSSSSSCVVPGTTQPLSNQTFALYDGASSQPYFDATRATNGFTANGRPCTGFNSNEGNDACPFRFELRWSAVCTNPASCVQPQVQVSATLRYVPKTPSAVMNLANFSIPTLYRGAF